MPRIGDIVTFASLCGTSVLVGTLKSTLTTFILTLVNTSVTDLNGQLLPPKMFSHHILLWPHRPSSALQTTYNLNQSKSLWCYFPRDSGDVLKNECGLCLPSLCHSPQTNKLPCFMTHIPGNEGEDGQYGGKQLG